MDEAVIYEGFAVYASRDPSNRKWIRADEMVSATITGVRLDIGGWHATLAPDQARRLASRLYRLARRVEIKVEAKS